MEDRTSTNGRPKQTQQGRKTLKQCNTLTGGEKFKLWSALVEAKGEFEAVHADLVQAAEMMSQRLGFKVTRHNVRDAVAQGIVDWSWKRVRGPSRLAPKLEHLASRVDEHMNVLSDLAGRFKALEDRLVAVEDIVLRLCHASGTAERVTPLADTGQSGPMRAPEAWVSK